MIRYSLQDAVAESLAVLDEVERIAAEAERHAATCRATAQAEREALSATRPDALPSCLARIDRLCVEAMTLSRIAADLRAALADRRRVWTPACSPEEAR